MICIVEFFVVFWRWAGWDHWE